MLIINEKMKRLLARKYYCSNDYIQKICNDIVSKTICRDECIMYDEQGDKEDQKINWEYMLECNGNLSGCEIAINEIILEREIFSGENVVFFLECLNERFREKFPDRRLGIVMSYCDNIGTLRFHTYRLDDGLWISTDIDDFIHPVLYEL